MMISDLHCKPNPNSSASASSACPAGKVGVGGFHRKKRRDVLQVNANAMVSILPLRSRAAEVSKTNFMMHLELGTRCISARSLSGFATRRGFILRARPRHGRETKNNQSPPQYIKPAGSRQRFEVNLYKALSARSCCALRASGSIRCLVSWQTGNIGA